MSNTDRSEGGRVEDIEARSGIRDSRSQNEMIDIVQMRVRQKEGEIQ
jgi:hypothetical protein